MIVGEASTTVSATPNEVFDFVLDLEAYRQADRKIGKVGAVAVLERVARSRRRGLVGRWRVAAVS